MIQSRAYRKRNSEFTFSWWLFTIFISFIISSGIIWVIHSVWQPKFPDIAKLPQQIIGGKTTPSEPKLPTIKKKELILAMGVDSNGRGTDPFKGTRSDVMIVVALDPHSKTINAISIPRDSKVYIAEDHGIDKINAAHSIGGPELAVKTVNQTLGIELDHYIVVDYRGLKELVKALGGVNVYVEKRMKYTDNTAKLFIDLEPGRQLLDANHAEMYLRFRHDAQADIGRIKRQQWFLRGVLEKLKEPAIIFKLPQLIEFSQKYIRTDMNVGQLMGLAGFAKDVDFSKIQVATLPGNPNGSGRISYWLLDVDQSQAIIDRMVFGFEENESIIQPDATPITLSIMYNSEKKETYQEILTALETQENFKVICKNVTREPHTKIISHTNRATSKKTSELRNNINQFKNAPVFLAPQDIYCASSDYTLVLGKD